VCSLTYFLQGRGPTRVDVHIAIDDPAQQSQLLMKRCKAGLKDMIVRTCGQQHAYAAHPLALLRARRERPCGRRATEQRDELAPPHVEPPLPGVGPPHVQLATGWPGSLISVLIRRASAGASYPPNGGASTIRAFRRPKGPDTESQDQSPPNHHFRLAT